MSESKLKRFQVYGDYGLTSQQLLEDFDNRAEAISWAKGYCRRDLSGYSSVEVASFHEDGEMVTHWDKREDDE